LTKLRVGYPDTMDPEFLHYFPAEVEMVCIPAEPVEPITIDFWIPPAFGSASKVWPWLRGVRVAQSLMAGVDWLRAIVGPELLLCDAQGVHNIPTAEWAVTAILASYKYIPFYEQLRQTGDWRGRVQAYERYRSLSHDSRAYTPPVLVEELAGKRVLIVGYGAIGKAIEQRLLAFEVETIRIARTAREQVYSVSALDELLPQADVVVLILPLTAETSGLIGTEQIARMKQGALLVNAARGGVVKTDALVDALNAGRIRAAVDVTNPEPLPEDHPLWKCPNLLITPHVAGSSPSFGRRSAQLAADQVQRFAAGEPLINIVTGEY
jgi:phosphoglycerate dehydrogenase-like enzyme